MRIEHDRARACAASSPAAARSDSGSSASAVPTPTMIASCSARSICTRPFAAAPVIERRGVPGVARPQSHPPSRRSFSVTIGRPFGDAQDMAEIGAARGVREHAGRTSMPAVAQPRMAAPGDARVGIVNRRDDARDAGRDHRIGAGRRAAVMAAGLQRDIERRAAAASRRPRASASVSACGRPPGAVQPRPMTSAVLDDHAPTAGLGAPCPRPRRAKCERGRHEARVVASMASGPARRLMRRVEGLDSGARPASRPASACANSSISVSKSRASRKLR